MSIDLPANVERELERYAQAEHISLAEAAVKQSGLKATRRKAPSVPPLSQEELNQLGELGKTFGLLADESDEAIDRMAATVNRMKRERFPARV